MEIFLYFRIFQKFTITGSPDENTPYLCSQAVLIEGPGLKEDGWSISLSNYCLALGEKPLKVYATRNLNGTRKKPIDGVIRNIAFTNIATDTTVNTFCTASTSAPNVRK